MIDANGKELDVHAYAGGRVVVVKADITTLVVDCVVNAANSSLLGGSGVDGAIHRRAGPGLAEFCRGLGGAKTGEVKLTPGFGLPAKHIAHAVGPVWPRELDQSDDDGIDEKRARCDAQLRSCYAVSLDLAVGAGCVSVAFPCISTGIFRFPVQRAAAIAIRAVADGLARHPSLARVVFCCFSDDDARLYRLRVPELLR